MCDYCEGRRPVLDSDNGFTGVDAYVNRRELSVSFRCDDWTYNADFSALINYCPMCGSKLGGDEQ